MRITIDVDGTAAVAGDGSAMPGSSAPSLTAAAADPHPVDGGAGPGGGNATGVQTLTADEADGGGPDQALLAAVAAAERDGTDSANAPDDHTDAGAGPAGTG